MEAAANWIAPLTTTLAAVMVALNAGTRITGFGFIVFSIGSVAWAYIGWSNGQMNLVWQNAILLIINLIGIWRWLGVRARYEQGAAVAAERSTWMALLPTAKLCGAMVSAANGEALGTIHELMIDAGTGAIRYAVLAVGGVAGIGEKLFALPWHRVDADGDSLSSTLTRAKLDRLDGFDKDAWPTDADPRL